jgi:hypothetical protein
MESLVEVIARGGKGRQRTVAATQIGIQSASLGYASIIMVDGKLKLTKPLLFVH